MSAPQRSTNSACRTYYAVDWDRHGVVVLTRVGTRPVRLSVSLGCGEVLRDQLRDSIRAVSDAAPGTPHGDAAERAQQLLTYEFCHDPYHLLMRSDIPLSVREALFDALADVYAEVGTDYFLRRRVALFAVGTEMFAQAAQGVTGDAAEYINSRMVVAGCEWLRSAAAVGAGSEPKRNEALENDTRDWFLRRQKGPGEAPIPLSEAVQSWLHPENANARRGAVQATCEQCTAGKAALRPEWRNLFVDTWALRARLSPWLAQDAEQAGLGRWASLFFAFGRVILHICGFILLLAALVGVFYGWIADWLCVAANGWLTVIAVLYVAVVILSPYLGRAYVPRLLALSVIGYMALTQLPEARHLQVQGAGSWQPAALTLGSVVLVWAYMLFGQLRAKTQQVWTYAYAGRALYLTVLGWAHSMSAGLLGFWALRGQVPETQFVVLAAWAPMALAIGIIAQTLWQRDAITGPI